MPTLIRHLKGDTHAYSRHLIDHSLCNKINIYRCTHSDCSTNNNTFFQSLRAYKEHNKNFHPLTCIPTQSQTTQNNMALFDSLFEGPGSTNLTNNWNHGCMYISNNYHQDPPHFRSTWRHFYLRKQQKTIQLPLIIHYCKHHQNQWPTWLGYLLVVTFQLWKAHSSTNTNSRQNAHLHQTHTNPAASWFQMWKHTSTNGTNNLQ